ncbi:hypothetical protein KQX54_011718 [Cotesia glomerata]|uniref:Uncharacterized protein n=1 Tax=Cotesia glomerata TaxID=32391 RepID=A0AAV7J7A0_COTGL|nr:hypothetical protein KQX54_011718 [Cotesia glomerata]
MRIQWIGADSHAALRYWFSSGRFNAQYCRRDIGERVWSDAGGYPGMVVRSSQSCNNGVTNGSHDDQGKVGDYENPQVSGFSCAGVMCEPDNPMCNLEIRSDTHSVTPLEQCFSYL